MAKLFFRYGTMSSGKTMDLMKTYYNYLEKGMNSIIVKPNCDTKGADTIVSRNGASIKVDFLIKEKDNIYDIVSKEIVKRRISCILVDECQFLSEKHVDELGNIADFLDIPVICYGLRVDFQDKLFTGSKKLFEIADSLEEMKTICKCGKKATQVVRFVNGKAVLSGEQIAIDGEKNVTYESFCRKCKKELFRGEK